MARHGYRYNVGAKWAIGIMLIHGIILAALGYFVWPRITVSPSHVSFQGYSSETFNFSVRNGRSDDVYDVQIPFLIGYGKHWDAKLSAKVMPNSSDPPQRLYDDYNYCYGKGPDVHDIQPNEREVLIVRIVHMPPGGTASFSITYSGGNKFETQPGPPNFISEPYSYSPMQGEINVRGNYRICKSVISTNGLVGR